MAQLTRGQLKGLVKECLVEILSEGLSSRGETNLVSPESIQEKKSIAPKTSSSPLRSSSPALNSVVFGSGRSEANTPARRTAPENKKSDSTLAIKNHISTITSDPIMSQIFADTAASTLQEQIHADRGQGRPDVSSELIDDPLTDNFLSESAKNWSALAFSDSSKNR